MGGVKGERCYSVQTNFPTKGNNANNCDVLLLVRARFTTLYPGQPIASKLGTKQNEFSLVTVSAGLVMVCPGSTDLVVVGNASNIHRVIETSYIVKIYVQHDILISHLC